MYVGNVFRCVLAEVWRERVSEKHTEKDRARERHREKARGQPKILFLRGCLPCFV